VKYLVLILLFLCSCSREFVITLQPLSIKTFTVALPCKISELDKQVILDGLNYWDDLTKVSLFKVNSCTSQSDITIFLVEDYAKDINGLPKYYTHGRAFNTTGLFFLYLPWLESDNKYIRTTTVRHELGHLLGFRHSKYMDCLMYPEVSSKQFYKEPKELCTEEKIQFHVVYGTN